MRPAAPPAAPGARGRPTARPARTRHGAAAGAAGSTAPRRHAAAAAAQRLRAKRVRRAGSRPGSRCGAAQRGSGGAAGRGRGGRGAARRTAPPQIADWKWTDEDFAKASPARCRWARRPTSGLRRRRRRVQEGGPRPRRNLRDPVDRPSAARNAHGDGLLAERQAVTCTARRRAPCRRSRRSRAGPASTPDKVVIISEYTGGGFGSKIPGAISMAIPALLSKKANAPVMMRITREDEHYIGRARPGIHARVKIGFAQGRPHHRDRHVRRSATTVRTTRRATARSAGTTSRSRISRRRCGGAV